MEKIIKVDGDNVGISLNGSGVEVIRFNGEEVSRKFSILGALHAFKIVRDDKVHEFEVKIRNSLHGCSAVFEVKKDGQGPYTGSVQTLAAGLSSWAIGIMFFLLFSGNPSEESHRAAVAEQYKAKRPIVSVFVPKGVVGSQCGYNNFLIFSVTKDKESICSLGVMWKVFVRK